MSTMNDYVVAVHGPPISRIEAALDLCDRLQGWLESHSSPLCSSFSYSINGVLIVAVGEFVVWCSEDDSEDDFTFEYCRDAVVRLAREYPLTLLEFDSDEDVEAD